MQNRVDIQVGGCSVEAVVENRDFQVDGARTAGGEFRFAR
jgi:hypothetical protein